MDDNLWVIMQNIKIFTEYKPLQQQVDEGLKVSGRRYRYLRSEDGQDWYECQKLFSDTTVKLMYDGDSVIKSVVNEPISQRGYTYAVSMFFPENMSVAETEGSLPEGFELDTGTWLFDGKTVYQDASLLAAYNLRKNKIQRLSLANNAAINIAVLQAAIARERTKPGDSDALISWDNYLCNLRDMTDVELQQSSVSFPEQPATIL